MINTNLNYCKNPHYSREIFHELEVISNKDYLCTDELSYIELSDATILPEKEGKGTALGLGGIVDKDNHFVEESKFHFVWDKEIVGFGGNYEVKKEEIIFCDDEVLYLGPLKNEWGHFLIDFMQRLWYVAKYPGKYKIAYIEVKSFNYGKPLLKNIIEMFSLLGIPEENLISIKKPTRFRKIILPQMYMGAFGYKKGYMHLYDALKLAAKEKCKGLPTFEKIYYTRCQLKDHKEIGEEQIEAFFANNGYKILAPEKLSAKEQIYYMSHCKYFACIEGSAAHNIVFAEPELKQYIIGKRCRNNLRQPIINQMMNIDVTYISAFSTYKRDDGFFGPFLMKINNDLKNFAKDNEMIIANNRLKSVCYSIQYIWLSNLQYVSNKYHSVCRKIKRNKE